MIEQKQKITDFKKGDCFRTCVTSLLELPHAHVFNFMEGGEQEFNDAVRFFNKRNGIILLDFTIEDKQALKDVICIATGTSPRDESKNHSVVWLNGKCIMDPHPDETGIIGEPKLYTLIIPKDPVILKNLCDKG
jgi:hypothetical protein